MSNQATADLDDSGAFSADLADAGTVDHGSGWEGHESDPGSAHNPGPTHDAPASDGSGRRDGADVQDEIDSREAYLAHLESLDLDAIPLEADHFDAPEASEPAPEPTAEDDHIRSPQFRLRPRTPLGERVFALMKADPELDEESAFDLARASLGMAPRPSGEPAPDSEEFDEGEESDPVSESVSDLQARIRELRHDLIAKRRDYDMDGIADLEEQILAIEDQIPVAQEREAERSRLEAEQETAWDRAASASWHSAVADYPQAADPNSAFASRMREIDEAWSEAGDARYGDPAKAEVIARIVAKELGVRPGAAVTRPNSNGRSLPAPASSRTSVPSPRPGPAAVMPASGSARTAADTPTDIEVAIQRAATPEDYERLRDRVLARL